MHYNELVIRCRETLERWFNEEPTVLFKTKDGDRFALINKQDSYLFNLFTKIAKKHYLYQVFHFNLYNLFNEFAGWVIDWGKNTDVMDEIGGKKRFNVDLSDIKEQIIAFLTTVEEDERLLNKYKEKRNK